MTDDYAGNTSTTGTVAIGGHVTGSVETAGDKDWFQVTLSAGTTYLFDLRGIDGGGGTLGSSLLTQPYLSLYDPRGLYVRATSSGGTGGDPQLTYTATVSGTFYLGVDELFRTGTGTYTLRASTSTSPTPTPTPTASDDVAANSSTTGRAVIGGSTAGRIESAGDNDWFAITFTAGTSYRINLDGTTSQGLLDPYLRLYNSSGTLVGTDDDSGTGLSSQLTYVPATTGTYYIGASSSSWLSSGTGGYNVTVATTSAPTPAPSPTPTSGDDFAGNNSTAGRAVIGGSTGGRIESASDNDWFAITFTAGTSYRLNLDSAASQGLSDPYLRLYNSSGTLVGSDDDGGTGLNSQLSYAPTTTGTYYVSASSYGSGTGAYNVTISTTSTPTDDFSANSSTTGRAVIGGSTAGRIESAGDNDWFAITFTAGTSYRLNLDSAASQGLSDPYLRLYNSSGTLVAWDDDSGSGLNSQLSYAPTTTGTYYVGASSASWLSSGTGGYNLTLSTSTVTTATDDFAANSFTTGRVAVGGSTAGRIESSGDSDWFAVTLTAGTAYRMNLDAASSGGLSDPYLRLYDGNGTPLSSDDDSGSGLNAQLSYTPTSTATFYLAASSSAVFSTSTGSYTLSIASAQVVSSTSDASRFNIDIQYTGSSQYRAAFANAVARWESIVTGDLPSVTNARYGNIDDLLIIASIGSIDGVGGTLGHAAPSGLRSSGLPYLGIMEFDSADIDQLIASGRFEGVILHEMAHVLGLGTLWDTFSLISPTNEYQYVGSTALSAWRVVSTNPNATYVPLETEGGAGTAGAHWLESILGDEIMTGYVDMVMPFSIVTVGSLADLGYVVDYSRADTFFIV